MAGKFQMQKKIVQRNIFVRCILNKLYYVGDLLLSNRKESLLYSVPPRAADKNMSRFSSSSLTKTIDRI